MNSNVCIIKTNHIYYPQNNTFRPSYSYPEYFFKNDISSQDNHVYSMVREALALMGYDKENYGTESWNPLGHIIKPGSTVLLKPNLVMDINRSGEGTDCLITHPSIVAAVIDYVVIALKGVGEVIVGDAPMQECKFEKLINEIGYADLANFYKEKLPRGIGFELLDFREVISEVKNGLHFHTTQGDDKGKVISLGEESEFFGETKRNYDNMRITNYDPRILKQHHNEKVNEYYVNKKILDADVIINIPKPKTHRKAGVTIALKNLVGINARKEYLPHHTNGSIEEGGDEYKFRCTRKQLKNYFLDKENISSQGKKNYVAAFCYDIANRTANLSLKMPKKDDYFEGSWYGNDTISKTIVDLNKILFYADKKGNIKKEVQRKYLIVADMVISGEKEGPVMPSPKELGVVAIGENPVCFDECIAKLMGANIDMINTLKHARNPKGKLKLVEDNCYARIVSNDQQIDNKSLDEIKPKDMWHFIPSSGWKEAFYTK